MAIERIIPPFPIEEDLTPPMQVDIETDGASATETEDGGMLIDFDPNAFEQTGDFFANLADEMSEDALKKLSTELIGQYQGDRDSRKEWENTYI